MVNSVFLLSLAEIQPLVQNMVLQSNSTHLKVIFDLSTLKKRDFSPLLRTSYHFLLFAGLVISISTLTLNPPERPDLCWGGRWSNYFILMPSGRRRVATLVKTKHQAKSFSASTLHGCLWREESTRAWWSLAVSVSLPCPVLGSLLNCPLGINKP